MESLLLLRAVRDVSLLADADAPEAVSQRAFDAARERSPNHAGSPQARRIAERLKLPWREVLAVAYAPEARQAQLVGVKTRAPSSADWLTGEHVAAVLQIVAARLGLDSLSLNEYRVERARILTENRRRAASGGELLLPTDEQIVTFAGSWDTALRLAGLAPSSQRRRPRQPRPRSVRQVVLSRVAVIERFYDHHGKRPTRPELEAFARGNNIPMKAERGRKWSSIIAEWERLRREQGLPPARHEPRPRGRPSSKRPRPQTVDYGRDVGAAKPGEHRIRGRWTRANCTAAVARYLAQLPNGARSTERGYADWAATQPRDTTPALATVQEHGGWEAVRRKAQGTSGE